MAQFDFTVLSAESRLEFADMSVSTLSLRLCPDRRQQC